jgi:hypothetical protein
LLNNAAGCRGRLDENGCHIVEGSADRMQVPRRQRQVLGEGTVAAADTDNRAHVAVPTTRRAAAGTASAAYGNLAHDAAPDPFRRGRPGVFDDADELVARYA